jgi:two-component system cell cycle response regulator
MRITKKVFYDLAIYMIGFGVVIGLVFPFFIRFIGVPVEYITPFFIFLCIFSGIVVGLINTLLVNIILGRRLRLLSERMKHVNQKLQNTSEINAEYCMTDCLLEVDSEDVIGEASSSFNQLIESFLSAFQSENSIRNFTEIFTNELDLEKLSEKALHHLIEYTQSSAGLVVIDLGGKIVISSSYLIKEPKKVLELDIINKCFSTDKQILLSFADDIIIEAGLIDFRPKSILLEPINYKGSVLGVIMLASTKDFDASLLSKLNVYTHGLSLGLHNAIIHDRLEQIAIIDPLTKTFNRRYGIERLKDEFNHSVQNNTPLGVLMLDIDHFKKVNDTYGHLVGDQVLITIAGIIKQNIRKGDVLMRYGGEEFFVILPGASQGEIRKIAEQIRRFTEENSTKYHDQEIKVTISIGGVSFPEFDIHEIDDLIAAADANLYKSKDSGRNKTTIT